MEHGVYLRPPVWLVFVLVPSLALLKIHQPYLVTLIQGEKIAVRKLRLLLLPVLVALKNFNFKKKYFEILWVPTTNSLGTNNSLGLSDSRQMTNE